MAQVVMVLALVECHVEVWEDTVAVSVVDVLSDVMKER
jgi:hypothetical protein